MAQVQHQQVRQAAILGEGESHGRFGCRLFLCIVGMTIHSVHVPVDMAIHMSVDVAINTSIRYITCNEKAAIEFDSREEGTFSLCFTINIH